MLENEDPLLLFLLSEPSAGSPLGFKAELDSALAAFSFR
jgi:hypothetical protein